MGACESMKAFLEKNTFFDPTTTLCLDDIDFVKMKVGGTNEELLKVRLKCQKESTIGNGVVLEIFANGTFFCPVNALRKYLKTCPIKLDKGKPLFRTETGANFIGRDFNKELAFLADDITVGTKGVIRSHSFRSGLATEMGLAGFSDEEIMAAGRWSSDAFRAYCKLPRSKRLTQQHQLVKKIMRK